MTNTLGAGGFEPRSNPAERRAQFDLRRQITGALTRLGLVEGRLDALETLTTPSTWTAVTFTNSWTNFGSGNANAMYRKAGDVVQLRGLVKSGSTGTSAFTLPTGFRPPAVQHLPSMDATSPPTPALIRVGTDGTVTLYCTTITAITVEAQFSVTA